MATTKSPHTYQAPQEIQHQELARLFGRIVGYRVLAIPFFAAIVLGVVYVEPYGWRSVVLSGIALLAAVFFLMELALYRKVGLTPASIPRNLSLASLGLVGIAMATGGAASPALYPILVLVLVMAVTMSRRAAGMLVLVLVAAVWLMAWFGDRGAIPDLNPNMFGGGARVSKGPLYLYANASVLTIAMVLGSQVGGAVRRSLDSILRRAVAAQQQSLEAQAEQVQQLTALSAEIAHELKNPLASVKGLSALLAQSIGHGKQAERLEVLRREVDRMQSVLEEFLNFSRPLTPLTVVDTDLATLCDEVALLHEGLQAERDVRLKVDAEPRSIRCDPRKLKQILINLVQNALDASPSGGTVTMQVSCRAEDADTASNPSPAILLRIIDEGPGVDARLGDVFRPGVTSKSAGSGLGLTIARALARQHGGELTLSPHERGGTVAEVTLPSDPGLADQGSKPS